MRRREFITFLGGAAATPSILWPLAAPAQETGRIYRIGMLVSSPRGSSQYVAFFDELRQLGFADGRNLMVDERGFDARDEQASELAVQFVKSAVDVIVCNGDSAVRAVQLATATIPILALADDMLVSGLVHSLARPGGNTTGISILATELDGKRQELLGELVPGARRMAALVDPATKTSQQVQELVDAARSRGVALAIHQVTRPDQILPAIDAARAAGAAALNVLATPLFSTNRQAIIARTAALRLPAIYQWPEIAEGGGLAGYGPRQDDIYRQRARQLVKLLRGVKPADLPVEQPAKFELIINLRAAKAIGHDVPAGLVLRADKVIE
jgi:putative ABC transport system substrate-binding protein